MPHGPSVGVPVLAEWIGQVARHNGRPVSIVDVGCGRGINGCTAVSYHNQDVERLVGIDAVRAFGECRRNLWGAYDEVIVGEAVEVLRGLATTFDIAICTDVLEHNSKENGRALMQALCDSAHNVFVTVPDRQIGVAPSREPFQAHVSLWTPDEFAGWSQVWPGGCLGVDSWCEIGWPMYMFVRGLAPAHPFVDCEALHATT